jgi:geranylgeranyl diphosphate synthase type I
MDGSDSRRNLPAIHKLFERRHLDQGLSGSAERFGIAAAILLGDLALSWSDWLLADSGVEHAALNRANRIFQEMREELMIGQYLDVLEGALASSDRSRSMQIANLKSGKYSIERPLHFGAALAGADSDTFAMYSRYGLPLGQAFQLRDDLLGVFGDSKVTGKPSGDDLREGKRTVLIAMALESSNLTERAEIESALGRSNVSQNEISRVQELIEKSGARGKCESLIEELLGEAISALANPPLPSEIRSALEEMANLATKRSS